MHSKQDLINGVIFLGMGIHISKIYYILAGVIFIDLLFEKGEKKKNG